MNTKKIILDTDIGTDVDDVWALGLLLKSPELDLKLVTTVNGDTIYRSKIVAKFLQRANRCDIPIGIGCADDNKLNRQWQWVENYDIEQYPGKIYYDGVQAMIDMVMSSSKPVTIISIGPLTNIAEAVKRCPEITQNAEIIGMHGSIKSGKNAIPGKVAEYNVLQDVESAKLVFKQDWNITITPLDTCGIVKFRGEKYSLLKNSDSSLVKDIIENYRIWDINAKIGNFEVESSILFDTVAIYLGFTDEYLNMERIKLVIDGSGFMNETDNGKDINVAISWNDLEGYEDFLIERYLSNPKGKTKIDSVETQNVLVSE
ncbi:MAG: nucleoside hydrolase [Sedimentisphaeraceae bacterium JB056]